MSISLEDARKQIEQRLAERETELIGGEQAAAQSMPIEKARSEIDQFFLQQGVAPQIPDQLLAAGAGQPQLGPPLEEPSVRAMMGAADTYPEKLAALRKAYPEGELWIVRGPKSRVNLRAGDVGASRADAPAPGSSIASNSARAAAISSRWAR